MARIWAGYTDVDRAVQTIAAVTKETSIIPEPLVRAYWESIRSTSRGLVQRFYEGLAASCPAALSYFSEDPTIDEVVKVSPIPFTASRTRTVSLALYRADGSVDSTLTRDALRRWLDEYAEEFFADGGHVELWVDAGEGSVRVFDEEIKSAVALAKCLIGYVESLSL